MHDAGASHFPASTCRHLHFDGSLPVMTTDFYQGQSCKHLREERQEQGAREEMSADGDGRGWEGTRIETLAE